MNKRFGKKVEFKMYLNGGCEAGTRPLFKFASGTRGLNEELGRPRGKSECTLCGAERESVVHVLWECSAYGSSRVYGIYVDFKKTLGDEHLGSAFRYSRQLKVDCWQHIEGG